MSKSVAMMALALLCAHATRAHAQVSPSSALVDLLERPDKELIGQWAEYAALANGKPDLTDTTRISIIGDEDPSQPPWLEVWMDKMGRTATRMRRSDKLGMQMFVKMGSAVYSVGSSQAQAGPAGCASGTCAAKSNPNRLDWKPVTLKTVAGTYQCLYKKIPSTNGPIEVWYADAVPAMRVARVQLLDGKGWELVASGTNAASSFPARISAGPLPLENLSVIEGLVPKVPPPPAPDAGAATSPDGGR